MISENNGDRTVYARTIANPSEKRGGNFTFASLPGQNTRFLNLLNITSAHNNTCVRAVASNGGGVDFSEITFITVQVDPVSSNSIISDGTNNDGGDGVTIIDGDGNDTGPLVGGIVAILVFCCCLFILLLIIFIIIVLILVRRRTMGDSMYRKLIEPDYELLLFDGKADSMDISVKKHAKLLKFEKLLVSHHAELLHAIIRNASDMDFRETTEAIGFIMLANNCGVEVITDTIREEIKSNGDENASAQIFRFDSNSMRLYSFFARMVGLQHIWITLAGPVNELLSLAKDRQDEDDLETGSSSESILQMHSIEVDPRKMADAADSEINTLELWLIAQKLFRRVVQNAKKTPRQIVQIMAESQTILGANEYDDEATHSAMGNFFWLRYMCPSLVAPHLFGLTEEPPNAKAQRQLVLLVKVLQNLANGSLPGKKEEYMQRLNGFITTNREPLEALYGTLLENVEDLPDQTYSVPDDVRLNAVALLHAHVYSNREEIEDDLQTSAVLKRLQTVMKALGKPSRKRKQQV
eukprot:TRINITY_DN3374_c0_g2_i1.p1 TRINITY_DN3374_c0_g2~~TRINITY_DN3374_c0_g2_i1.p1  ORF type:complete len:524 (-),score=110.28 TRINITY_DN3374_c0_g2_i1:283-1854(-)